MKGKALASSPAAGPAGSQAAAAPEDSSAGAPTAAAEDMADGQEDALDAFMSNVQHQIEEDKVRLGLQFCLCSMDQKHDCCAKIVHDA